MSTAVDALLRLGYEVEAHPVSGLRLRVRADVVDRDRVSGALETTSFGRTLVCHAEAGSTNDLAWALADEGASDGTVVVAEYQSSGRGRRGRSWHSPPSSGLWFSVLMRPEASPDQVGVITLGAGVAVAEAVGVSGLRCTVKWPNDVQVRERKLAGILTESRVEGGKVAAVVIGIGLNVHQDAGDFPQHLRPIATSIYREGRTVERSLLLAEILNRLEAMFSGSTQSVLSDWRRLAVGWNEPVRVDVGDKYIEGDLHDLTEEGALVILDANENRHVIYAGDVHSVRTGTSSQ